MIRAATLDDVPTIAKVGRVLHDESPSWARFQYDEQRVEQTMRGLLAMGENALLLVVEREGEIVGGIAAMAVAHWSSVDMVAQEMSLFLLPEARGGVTGLRLVKMLRQWAYDIGCVRVQGGTTTLIAPEIVVGLYRAAGFEPIGSVLECWLGRD